MPRIYVADNTAEDLSFQCQKQINYVWVEPEFEYIKIIMMKTTLINYFKFLHTAGLLAMTGEA